VQCLDEKLASRLLKWLNLDLEATVDGQVSVVDKILSRSIARWPSRDPVSKLLDLGEAISGECEAD